MLCSRCDATVPASDRFCPACGQPAVAQSPSVATCPQCRNALVLGDRFCAGCGRSTAAPAAAAVPTQQTTGPSRSLAGTLIPILVFLGGLVALGYGFRREITTWWAERTASPVVANLGKNQQPPLPAEPPKQVVEPSVEPPVSKPLQPLDEPTAKKDPDPPTRPLDSAAIKQSAKQAADQLSVLAKNKDYVRAIDLMHPELLKFAGGRKKLLFELGELDKEIVRISVEIGEPSEPVTSGDSIYVVIPAHLVTQTATDASPRLTVPLIAVSSDAAKSWTFVRGDLLPGQMALVLPELPPAIRVHLKTDPLLVEAANRMISVNNMKQLALAIHGYHDVHGHLPANFAKDGNDLLSWRVAVLPFLEEQKLYDAFKLDEPWDSPHNKKLLPKMPKAFELPGSTESTATFYLAFNGKGAAFEHRMKLRFRDFSDGLSLTLLVAEAARSVPWSKPDDLPFVANQPLPKLGGHFRKGFNAALADGSVFFLRSNFDEKTFRALITRAGGEVINVELLRVDASKNP